MLNVEADGANEKVGGKIENARRLFVKGYGVRFDACGAAVNARSKIENACGAIENAIGLLFDGCSLRLDVSRRN